MTIINNKCVTNHEVFSTEPDIDDQWPWLAQAQAGSQDAELSVLNLKKFQANPRISWLPYLAHSKQEKACCFFWLMELMMHRKMVLGGP